MSSADSSHVRHTAGSVPGRQNWRSDHCLCPPSQELLRRIVWGRRVSNCVKLNGESWLVRANAGIWLDSRDECGYLSGENQRGRTVLCEKGQTHSNYQCLHPTAHFPTKSNQFSEHPYAFSWLIALAVVHMTNIHARIHAHTKQKRQAHTLTQTMKTQKTHKDTNSQLSIQL